MLMSSPRRSSPVLFVVSRCDVVQVFSVDGSPCAPAARASHNLIEKIRCKNDRSSPGPAPLYQRRRLYCEWSLCVGQRLHGSSHGSRDSHMRSATGRFGHWAPTTILAMDPLSDVLRSIRLDGAYFFAVEAAGQWRVETVAAKELAPRILPAAEHLISYHILTHGRCYAGWRRLCARHDVDLRISRLRPAPVQSVACGVATFDAHVGNREQLARELHRAVDGGVAAQASRIARRSDAAG